MKQKALYLACVMSMTFRLPSISAVIFASILPHAPFWVELSFRIHFVV